MSLSIFRKVSISGAVNRHQGIAVASDGQYVTYDGGKPMRYMLLINYPEMTAEELGPEALAAGIVDEDCS